MVLPVASLLSVKRVSLSLQLLRNHLRSETPSTQLVSLLSSANCTLAYYNGAAASPTPNNSNNMNRECTDGASA